jgi:putative FmdB family regulatory protein
MPQYDHTCSKCKHDFTVEMKISEVDKKEIACPKCKSSKQVSRNVTNKSFWSESINRYKYDK